MSSSRSDDVLRPGDHVDTPEAPTQPALGLAGWLRWGWRQLTSMRTALVLLLLLAIFAIPGSIVPQRSADPNGVIQYRTDNPELYPVLDALQLFDVYTSVWFSAIYILLFVSLIGCVIPRIRHHAKALRSRPPRTPARLSRLADHAETVVAPAPGRDAAATASAAVDLAEQRLRRSGYRVERYDTARGASVSAERGYLRETGNLMFHGALVGVLLSVGIGGGFTYTGQTVITEGDTFVNSLGLGYTSFSPGRFVDVDAMPPYTLTLDSFDVSYVPLGQTGAGQAGDFAAHLTVREPGGEPEQAVVRVNHPLDLSGDRIYLMGNGYAPIVTVRNGDGDVVFREAVPFLPQDTQMTSLGVVKVADGMTDADGMPEQLGLVGFFYPTAANTDTGALASAYPDLLLPVMTLEVYEGDLGIDDGTPRSVYTLDTSDMTQIAGRDADAPTLELSPGQTIELPDGRGSVTFEDATADGAAGSVHRYVSLSIHRDAGATWVLVFSVLAVLGLLAGLFVPRRRLWVKATPEGDTVRIEYAGLARGEDPAIRQAVDELAAAHGRDLAELAGRPAARTPA